MNFKPRISLRVLFGIMTIAAVLIYWLLPITIEVTCDFGKSGFHSTFLSVGDRIDIQGRNKGYGFKTIVRNIRVTSCTELDHGNRKQISVEFISSLYQKWRLDKYEIRRIAGKGT